MRRARACGRAACGSRGTTSSAQDEAAARISRRDLLKLGTALVLGGTSARAEGGGLRLFLAGDVMLGRGIDQIMPRSAGPRLYEPHLTDARQYIDLAEAANGPIPRAVDPDYVWGDALTELDAFAPDFRLVNLETAVTRRGSPWPGKWIHYRMHPANVAVLQAARIDCCAVANNHVLDWGYDGLQDSLAALAAGAIHSAGAGPDSQAASAAAVLGGAARPRVSVFGLACTSSGVPAAWAATGTGPGVNLIGEDIAATVDAIGHRVGRRTPGHIVVASIHWGGNWGYEIPAWQRRLAHALIDSGSVDLVHGHSSHHAKAIEVYRGRLILYGCGDLINDYEGISGHREYRGDLGLMYFVTLDPLDGSLRDLTLSPVQMHRFRIRHAAPQDARWLLTRMNREGERFGTRFVAEERNNLRLRAPI